MPTTYNLIQTVNGDGSSIINLTSIPGTFDDLVLIIGNLSSSVLPGYMKIRFNNDSGSTNYQSILNGSSSGSRITVWREASSLIPYHQTYLTTGQPRSTVKLDIGRYTSTTNDKTFQMISSIMYNEAGTEISNIYGSYLNSSSAISSIQISMDSGNFASITASIYGIKAA